MTSGLLAAAWHVEPDAGEASVAMAVAFPGNPDAPATWSGTPRGVLTGFRTIGVDARPATATPPEWLHTALLSAAAAFQLPRAAGGGARTTLQLSRSIARDSPSMARVYSRAARAALRRTGPVDAVAQLGTGYAVPGSRPIITYEDMTIRQALECGYPEWRYMSMRQRRRRLDLQHAAYEAASACCLTTGWAARSVIEDYGVPREKVHVVGVGRNHTVDPPADRDWQIPSFLLVGWEWERKNGPAVLRAFNRVRNEQPRARLDLVGRHAPVSAPGVTDHGILRLDRPGDRARLESLYRKATCFVMPSRCEPSALAYVEAMHAGLPCIGTTVGGAADLIGNGGCVVDPSDDDALCEAMLTYADPVRARRLGEVARARSILFTWPAVASRLLRALQLPTVDESRLAPFLRSEKES